MSNHKAQLTAKQQKFCEEYLIDLNATQAAVRAGYSKKRADQIGFENLRKPEIDERIAKLRKIQTKRTLITADRVLEELESIALIDVSDPDIARTMLNGKLKALELLGKHLVLFDRAREQERDVAIGMQEALVCMEEHGLRLSIPIKLREDEKIDNS